MMQRLTRARAPPVQRHCQTPAPRRATTPAASTRSTSPTRLAQNLSGSQDIASAGNARVRSLRSLGLRRTHYTPKAEATASTKTRSQRLRKVRLQPDAEGPVCGTDDLSIWSLRYGRNARLTPSETPDLKAAKEKDRAAADEGRPWFWLSARRSHRPQLMDEDHDQE